MAYAMNEVLEALIAEVSDKLTDIQAHMMATEIILTVVLDETKIERAPILALFQTMRESTPPEVAARTEEVLYDLLGLEAPIGGFANIGTEKWVKRILKIVPPFSEKIQKPD